MSGSRASRRGCLPFHSAGDPANSVAPRSRARRTSGAARIHRSRLERLGAEPRQLSVRRDRPAFRPAQVPQLTLKWAFGFEGEAAAATQPVIVGDWVFVGSASGRVYALGPAGRLHPLDLQGGRRRPRRDRARFAAAGGLSVIVADLRATVYSLDAANRPAAVEGARRGSPRGADQRRPGRVRRLSERLHHIFVGVSSGEEATGAQPELRVLHLPRQRRRRSMPQPAPLRGRPISFPIRRSRSAATRRARSCGGRLAPPSGRRRRSTRGRRNALRRDRRRLHASGGADDRRRGRAESQDRRDPVVAAVARQRCLEHGVRIERSDQLPGQRRARRRLRTAADSCHPCHPANGS